MNPKQPTSHTSISATPDTQDIFRSLPGMYIVLSPELYILNLTDAVLQQTQMSRDVVEGQYFFDVYPDTSNNQERITQIQQALEQVQVTQKPVTLPIQRYDLPASNANAVTEHYWLSTITPHFTANNELNYFILHSTEVTQQIRAEKKQKANQEKFELIAMATNDVIWDWDLLTNELWWNEGFKTTFGYQEDEVESNISSWTSRIHPSDEQTVIDSIHDVIDKGEKTWTAEYRFLKADGSYTLILDRGFVLHDSQGKPYRMLGAMLDISNKRQAELKLQESSRKIEQIMEAMPLMVWTTLPDGSVNYFNQRWYEYTGTTLEYMQQNGWEEFIHPDDLEPTLVRWQHSIKTGEKFECENRWLCKSSNTYQWFLARALPIYNSEGNISLWVGTHTNIQQFKEVLEELLKSKEQFEFLANTIPQMVWTTRPDGYHDYFNQRWMDYTKLTMEESIGMVWIEMVHPDDRQRSWNRWQHSLKTGEYYEVEYRFKNGFDGSYRWFLGQAMPMRDEEGNIVKWFGTCTDIEEQKQAKEKLLQKNDELKKTNEDLDSFVYTASHDLKLPIINMAGIFNELARTADFKDPEADRLVGMFNKSLAQIQNTISDLSEIVKIKQNAQDQREMVDLAALTEEVKLSIRDMIDNSGADIRYDFSEMPGLLFSRQNLKSIFYNLISNAIKYSSPERRPEVRISTHKKNGYLLLKISDNGIGINMNKHKKKMFQMFRRFHNHVSGSGLGLYIVNRIIQNNSGHIEVDSKENVGTTFRIYLKLTPQKLKGTHETA
ncbi:MAG: PAS domain-containing sensor histidine kinase [Hymenobacteraceae bacterium]|nr:PAS domain-containing sensor histidine kinase [Hymenobacteraceae bacterium]MDX5394836.1 PAS domain-containing sensor histidine kinase [Hymenobacteraceae bacterium]MDX5443239.1 PAS domain-containing sensor histidine kinase [Hymenobacteraceae bacterium]MDX5510870.1 PAS domain-containing sensor histidine kinase [Hymenobacteraceae bacterium]